MIIATRSGRRSDEPKSRLVSGVTSTVLSRYGSHTFPRFHANPNRSTLLPILSLLVASTALAVVLPATAAGTATSAEAHARAEFQKYAGRITGRPAAIDADGLCTVEGTASAFAIGRCRAVERLTAEG